MLSSTVICCVNPTAARQAARSTPSNHAILAHPFGVPRGAKERFAVMSLYLFASMLDLILWLPKSSSSIQKCAALGRPRVPIFIVMPIHTYNSPGVRGFQFLHLGPATLPGTSFLLTCKQTNKNVCMCTTNKRSERAS